MSGSVRQTATCMALELQSTDNLSSHLHLQGGEEEEVYT